MMVSVDRMRVLEVLAEATNVIAEGEVLQLMNMHDPDVTVESYLKVIRFKPPSCSKPARACGAVLADADRALEEACAGYGRALGTAFQLIDDVLDHKAETQQLGKTWATTCVKASPRCRAGSPWNVAPTQSALIARPLRRAKSALAGDC